MRSKNFFFPDLYFPRPRNSLNLIPVPALPPFSAMTSTRSLILPKPGRRPYWTFCFKVTGLLMSKADPTTIKFHGSHPRRLNVPSFFLPLSLGSCQHLLCPLGCLTPKFGDHFNNNNNNNNNSQLLYGSDIEMTAPESTRSACSWPIMESHLLPQCRYTS